MKLKMLLSFFLLSMLTIFVGDLLAAEKHCSEIEAMTAEDEAGSLKNWQDIYDSYKKFSHCDDGAIAEGYSDSIAVLLAQKWESLKDLRRLTENDKDFLKFVLRHIDATADNNDIQRIYRNSSRRCPKNYSKLCSLIKKAAEDALKEFKE